MKSILVSLSLIKKLKDSYYILRKSASMHPRLTHDKRMNGIIASAATIFAS
jgi:hypothetical protein